MQVIRLSKEGGLKLKRKEKALYKKDFEDLPRSILPGEWCVFYNEKSKEHYSGFVNLHAKENWPVAFMVCSLQSETTYVPWTLVEQKITKAIVYRDLFSVEDNCRLVYGEIDDLPGLIVDQFSNAVLIQINTAGMDQYRLQIKKYFEIKYSTKKIFLFDQKSYRESEGLPNYEEEALNLSLEIQENNLKLMVEANVLQKVGYYFDHRCNRLKAQKLIQSMNIKKETGLDLFSYVGSWGLHLLAAGIKNVTFVDQGNFELSVMKNAELNNFKDRAQFTRDDCFHYLDQCEKDSKTFDVICSDPPAFTKNNAGKIKALEGYTKLHTKVLKCINNNGLAIIGSCTHHVSLSELDETMQEASSRTGRAIRLLELGLQGHDHPVKGFSDKGNYIKYLAYYIE